MKICGMMLFMSNKFMIFYLKWYHGLKNYASKPHDFFYLFYL
jgi:hypothetical protein